MAVLRIKLKMSTLILVIFLLLFVRNQINPSKYQ
jgi:hypothetical protein